MAKKGEAAAAGLLDGPLHGDRITVHFILEPLGVVKEGHLYHGVPVPAVPVANKRRTTSNSHFSLARQVQVNSIRVVATLRTTPVSNILQRSDRDRVLLLRFVSSST